jgi:hypothetical protein
MCFANTKQLHTISPKSGSRPIVVRGPWHL